ncbi:MAG: hypothetical protein D6744_12995 [Planctomycetota bacterium]|nr:MAG: hypothetical protein D6744_12995 [Planctomycetota bacterium]
MQVIRPDSLDDALAALARDTQLAPVAGATDLFVSWPHREVFPAAVLDLSLLRSQLGGIRAGADGLEIGALVTYWDAICSSDCQRDWPLLVAAARQVGAIQIQTRGTWAGNIANGSPAADGVPVLMAYGARVVLASQSGRREVALDEYYTGYKESVKRADELIVAIRTPRRAWRRQWFYKVGARRAQAITKVGVAIVQSDDGWRVVANSVAPTVVRCRGLEEALNAGRSFGAPHEIADALKADISPIDDIRSTAAYRATVLSRLLYHWLREQGL